jgi:hypothetical protein
MRIRRFTFGLTAALLGLATLVQGSGLPRPVALRSQLGHLWSCEELTLKSDLVVVAERVSTQDTGVKTVNSDLQPALPVVEMKTDFKVLMVFKGRPLTSSVVLRHFRWDADRIHAPLVNAGSTLAFESGTGPYLLFLQAANDGYVPTSGQGFPTDSVYALKK